MSATRVRRTLVQDVPVIVLRHELSIDYQEPSLPQPEACCACFLLQLWSIAISFFLPDHITFFPLAGKHIPPVTQTSPGHRRSHEEHEPAYYIVSQS
jgi:hypothetical protein